MKKRAIKLGLLLQVIALPLFAQKDKTIIIVGKPMSANDSSMVRQLFFSALTEKTSENYTAAADLFTHILQVDPANDASMYELARIKAVQKDDATARSLYERAVTVRPENKYYWLALAGSYEKENDVQKLENVFEQLIRIDPNNPEYLFDKANTLFVEKKYDDALAVYKQLEQRVGLSDAIVLSRQKVYLRQGKINLATAELEEMIKQKPDNIRYYLLLGELYNSNNLNDKAQAVLERAEKADPGNEMVHLALADVFSDKKDYQSSYNQLKIAFAIPDGDIDQKIHIVMGYLPKFPDPNAKQSALELSRILTVTYPNNAKSYALYGDMLEQNEMFKEAGPVYKKSLALDKQVYNVWEQLVRIELSNSQYDDAVKDGEDALSYFPNQAWMNYLVGVSLLQKKEYNKALGYIGNVPTLETQDNGLLSQSYSAVGDCYHGLKDNKKSDEAYDKSIQLNPDNVYTLNNFAYYLSLRGDQLDKAAKMSKHSNDLQANNSSFEDTYAWILFKQKIYAEAKIWIEKALANDKSKNGVETEHYGDILFYLGSTDAAVENWKKAKQYGGGSPQLDQKINEKKYIE